MPELWRLRNMSAAGSWAGATRQTRLLYPWIPDELAALPTGMSHVGVDLRSSSSAGCLWRFLLHSRAQTRQRSLLASRQAWVFTFTQPHLVPDRSGASRRFSNPIFSAAYAS